LHRRYEGEGVPFLALIRASESSDELGLRVDDRVTLREGLVERYRQYEWAFNGMLARGIAECVFKAGQCRAGRSARRTGLSLHISNSSLLAVDVF